MPARQLRLSHEPKKHFRDGTLDACLLVARPHNDDQVLVVVSADEPARMLRGLARLMLRDGEREHLSRFLSDRRRKR